MAYKLGKVTILEDLSLYIRDWEVKALADSWFNTGAGLHEAQLKLYVATDLSAKVMGLFDKSKKVTDLLGMIAGKVDDKLSLIEDGKVVLFVKLSGILSDPELSYMNHLMSPLKRDSLKVGFELLEGLLR